MSGPGPFAGLPLADLIARRDRLRRTLAAIDREVERAETAASRERPVPPRPTRPIVVRGSQPPEIFGWLAHATHRCP